MVIKASSIGTLLSLLIVVCIGCFDMGDQTYSKVPPGTWRGVLKLDPDLALHEQLKRETDRSDVLIIDEVSEAELPFTFDVVYTDPETFHFEIINGEERIKVSDIDYGVDRATNKDTIRAYFEAYDSYIDAIFDVNVIEGDWVVPSRGDYRVHFVAHHGQDHRFSRLKKEPIADLTGDWDVMFGVETDSPFPAIGEFRQDGNRLLGTFRTETGDYRYLEGTVQADKMYLSCFDGAHMFLFEGKLFEDGSIKGLFRNGTHYLTSWEATRGSNLTLISADSLTLLKEDEDKVTFSFPDENGKEVSLSDPAFQGRPKIIQILGTWCPNCLDETEFLVDYLKNNDVEDLAIIGLAFERYEGDKARQNIARYRNRLQVPYPVLHAGLSDKDEASKQLPMLNEIISYPTLIFLDRDDNVIRIHTGFNGPATSKYGEFVESFDETIRLLLNAES